MKTTIQGLLLMDSTTEVRVGAGKLQQILTTMKAFKDEVLELNEVVGYHKNETKQLEKDKATLQERLTWSIDEIDELKGELEKARDEVELLRTIRMRVRTIDLSLEGLDAL